MGKDFIPENIFKTILDNVPICTVDVVLLGPDRKRTLLFKRNNEPLKEIYFSIGGRLNKGEELIECAVRQAKQELGLDLQQDKMFFGGVQVEKNMNSAFDGISYHTVNVFYGYILEEGDVEINLDGQHSEYRWFAVDDPSLHPFLKSKLSQTVSKNYD